MKKERQGFKQADYDRVIGLFNTVAHKDLTDMMTDVAQRLVADFKMCFRQQKGPDGKAWSPIHHRDGKALIDTGRLRNSINAKHTSRSVEVGTNVDYAATHQFGDTQTIQQNIKPHTRKIRMAFGRIIPERTVSVAAHSRNVKRNIKPRPFLGFERRQKHHVVKAFEHYITIKTQGQAR